MTSIITIDSNQEDSAITLGDDCLVIKEISNGRCKLDVNVLIDSNKILQRKAFKLKVELLENQRDALDPQISALLNSDNIADRKRARLLLFNGVTGTQPITILKQIIDITSFLDNNKTRKKSSKLNSELSFIKKDLVDESLAIKIPNKNIPTSDFKNKKLEKTKILDAGLDYATQLEKELVRKSNLFNEIIDGTVSEPMAQSQMYVDAFNLLNKEDKTKNLVSVFNSVITGFINVNKTYDFSLDDLKNQNYTLYVDLLDNNDLPIQTINRTVDVGAQIPFFNFPNTVPEFTINKNSFSDIVNVNFKKHSNKDDISMLVNDFEITTDKDIQQNFKLPMIGHTMTIKSRYFNGDNKSINFSSHTLVDRRYKSLNGVVNAYQDKESIIINAYDLSEKTISAMFYAVDLTLKSTKIISSQINVFNRQCSFTHSSPIPGHIYEYYVISYLSDGLRLKSKSIVQECYQTNEVGVRVLVGEPTIEENNFSFEMTADIQEKNTDVILRLLKEKGIDNFYDSSLSNQIDQIKKFISFAIFRFNLTTGEKDFMGNQTTSTFSDSDAAKLKLIKPFNINHQYQYEVYPSLIDSNTLFDDQVGKYKNINDLTIYNQQKFKHTYVIKNSMLLSSEGLKQKFSTSILDHNVLGYSTVIEHSQKNLDDVSNLQINVLKSLKKVKLTWSINSTQNKIDFFLISKSLNGYQTIIGKCMKDSQFYIDTYDQVGNLTYSLLPIHLDGSYGNVIFSSVVLT